MITLPQDQRIFETSDAQPVTTDESILVGSNQTLGGQDSVRLLKGAGSSVRSLSGTWQLSWDDDVDSKMANHDKNCSIEFSDVDGELTGRFIGLVAGTERDAVITGRFLGTGNQRILSFRQIEPGYVCSYQAIDQGGEIRGVWHDTRGASGDFSLLKYQ